MALSTRFPAHNFLPEQTHFGASFAPNGTSQPTSVSKGITVSRTGVGAFTVTLAVQQAAVVSLTASGTSATPGDFRPALGGVTKSGGVTTFTVTLLNNSDAAADVAANAANRVYFSMLLSSMSNAVT